MCEGLARAPRRPEGVEGGGGGLGTHREGVIDVEGDLPLLEGELLLAVPAHRHQPRHRRRFLLPAAEPASSPETPRR